MCKVCKGEQVERRNPKTGEVFLVCKSCKSFERK